MSKFFNEIVAPQLTQTDYGQGIESMVNNINANFQKVFTLPFLKGDDGDRLTTRFCPFWDETAKLTEEGYKIFEAIFIDEKIKNGVEFVNTKPGCTFDDLMTDLAKLFTESENSGKDQFRQTYGPAGNPKILLYYQIDTESNNETLLGAAQLYYFFDPRVQGLSDFIGANDTTTVEGFVDYTCILSTKYVNGDQEYSYEYEKQSGWPTLYFDSSSKQFCWQINGQKTGVNAQGVNGRDGRGSKIWLCVVKPTVATEAGQTMSTNVEYSKGKYTKFEIIDIWIPKVNEWLNINDKSGYDRALNALGESGLPSSGDVFIAYLYSESEQSIKVPVYEINEKGEWVDSGETEIFPKPPMSIYGTLFYDAQAEGDIKYYVFSNISQNLYRTTDNAILVDMLNHIGDYTGDNSSASNGVQDPVYRAKGLFVPLRETTTSATHAYVHALYNDRGSLNLKVDKLENVVDTKKSIGSELDIEKKDLNIIYNTKVDGTLDVTGTTALSDKLTVSSGGTDITGTTTIQHALNGNKIVVNSSGVGVKGSTIIKGTTIIQSSTNDCVSKFITVSDYGVGVNVTPSSGAKALSVAGGLNVNSGGLSVTGTTTLGDKLTVSSGGADITGGSTITGTTTIQSTSKGKSIVVNDYGVGINTEPSSGAKALNVSGGSTITGITTIRSATSGGCSIVVNSFGVGINNTPTSSDQYTLKVKGTLGVTGDAILNGALGVGGQLTISGGILPSKNAYNLGSSNYKWSNVYAGIFHGSLNGNASSAEKLTTTSTGNPTTPVYFSGGKPTGCNQYAGGTRLNINSDSYTSSGTIYVPTSAGNSGQVLVSNGSGAPTWGNNFLWKYCNFKTESFADPNNTQNLIYEISDTNIKTYGGFYIDYPQKTISANGDSSIGVCEYIDLNINNLGRNRIYHFIVYIDLKTNDTQGFVADPMFRITYGDYNKPHVFAGVNIKSLKNGDKNLNGKVGMTIFINNDNSNPQTYLVSSTIYKS